MNDGILGISTVYNPHFTKLLSWYGIIAGSPTPLAGIGNPQYAYHACYGYPDQINLYRLQRLIKGGLNGEIITECEISDSTRTLNVPFLYYLPNIWRLPKKITADYETLVDMVITRYLKKYDHISVLWSGGVDSTVIVASLIKLAKKEQWTLAYTGESTREYPVLWDYLNKGKFNTINLEHCDLNDLPGTIVHGAGSGAFNEIPKNISAIIDNSWECLVNYNDWGKDTDSLLEFGQKYVSISGKTNLTVADFCVFINTVTRMNTSYFHIHFSPTLLPNKLVPFYDEDEFFSWNYYYAAKWLENSDNPLYYKLPLKKYIKDVTGDDVYFKTKYKTLSRELWRLKSNPIGYIPQHDYFFIDYTGERVKVCNSLEEYRNKYNTRFDHYFNVN